MERTRGWLFINLDITPAGLSGPTARALYQQRALLGGSDCEMTPSHTTYVEGGDISQTEPPKLFRSHESAIQRKVWGEIKIFKSENKQK